MKTVTQISILVSIVCLLYLYWLHEGEISLLESDVDTLRAQVSDLAKPAAPKPRAPRKPKETTKK